MSNTNTDIRPEHKPAEFGYFVADQHGSSNIIMPDANTLAEVEAWAVHCAAAGHNAFYRAFAYTDASRTRYRFATSYSVLGGVVREHRDVTFPLAHFK